MSLSCGTRTRIVSLWAGQLALACALGLGWVAAGAAPKAPADTKAAKSAPEDADWLYTIQRRDTLYDLALAWLEAPRTWQDLQRLNRVADPLRLPPGGKLRMPVAWLKREAAVADVMFVKGAVTLRRGAEPAQPLALGAQLRSSDVLRTGEQASVSVRFADGSRLLVPPGSEVQLESLLVLGRAALPAVVLRVQQGGAENQVVPNPQRPPKYEVRTPKLNLGVRGTEFRGRVSGERTFAEVLEGRVAVGDRTLDAGTGVVATSSGVGPTRTLPGTPDLAAVPSVIARVPLSVAFAPLAGASAYRVRVVAAADPERTIVDGRFERAAAAWDEPVPDGEYRLQVRAIDAEGLEGRVADAPFTLKARPEPPFQLRPRAGDRIASPAVPIAWTRQPEAARYRIQVSADPSFTAARVDRADIDRTEIEVALAPGRYAWRVASIRDTGDVGPWSDPVAFEVVEPPPPPPPAASATPIAAVGSSAETGDEGLVFRWRAVPIEGVRYQVQVAQDPQFREIIVDDTTSATERRLADPRPGAYHVRVRAIGPDGRIGEYGAPQSVEVPARRGWLLLFPLILLLFVL